MSPTFFKAEISIKSFLQQQVPASVRPQIEGKIVCVRFRLLLPYRTHTAPHCAAWVSCEHKAPLYPGQCQIEVFRVFSEKEKAATGDAKTKLGKELRESMLPFFWQRAEKQLNLQSVDFKMGFSDPEVFERFFG
jgi:hypothetical protein